MKLRKPILVTIILAIVAAMSIFAVACGDDAGKTYTMRFETYGGTEIEPITAVGGSMIFAPSEPTKAGSTFMGWYTNSKFSGEAVTIPNIMPSKNVTYHAKFDVPKTEYTVIYEYNKGQVPHAKDIPNVTVAAGESVTVADGNDYGAEGYMFMGWSIYPAGLVTDVKQEGQYNAGDVITLTNSNIKLYAQWAVEHVDARKQNDDKIYVYEPLIGKGKGAAKLIRADETKQDLDGFVQPSSETASGCNEFTFYADEFENGEFMGRLYGNGTYATSDGKQGDYVMYDYIDGVNRFDYSLALDGFGYAVMTQLVGDGISVYASGDYEYDPEAGDYIFKYNTPKDADDAKPQTSYFQIVIEPVTDSSGNPTEFKGLYTTIGGESGTFINTANTSLFISLDGYGNATLMYGDDLDNPDSTVDGVYYGTDYYESARGEWQFMPLDGQEDAVPFKFIVGVVAYYGQYIPVFAICDETVVGTYASTDANDSSTLYLDGYGMAQYVSNGVVYEGDYTLKDGVVTLVCTTEENGVTVETDRMVFAITTGANRKFSYNADGLVVNNGVITTYTGKSTVVVIPETISGVTVEEIAADAFNFNNTDVSLTSVTIPATVTKIGARAFQNKYTLRRVVLLSETPAQLDYTGADNDPFRWGYDGGSFVIVVPDDAVDTYKTAQGWSAFADKIMGATEASKLPEWVTQEQELSDGTTLTILVQYNLQKELDDDELLDLVIPDNIDIVYSYVFRGMDFIRSVDLNNVIEVCDSAFYGCANLQTVKMPNVQYVDKMAFAACVKLNNNDKTQQDALTLPAIKIIGESAFSGCESLRLVQLGENISEIGDFAFYQCNVYEKDPTLVVELLGTTAPDMGEKVTLGNIAVRIKVANINVALNCYKNETWSAYVGHLYIESGEEKGMYMSGDATLELDGRAIYQGSYVWVYAIDGENITFYEYNSSSSSATHYTAILGTYKDGVIKMAIGSTMHYFKRMAGVMTYTSKDGNYTLICNPMDLQPDNYENNRGYADVKFNGKDVKLFINGYNTKVIYNYEENGKLYDIYISFNGDTLDVTKKLSDIRYDDLHAPDGSTITILFRNGLIYIEKAEFKIVVDEETGRTLYWDASVVFAKQNGNVFTFSFQFRNTVYNFTVTLSEDYENNKNFTYTYTKG